MSATDETPTKPSMQTLVDPTRSTRDRDQVLYRALVLGYEQAVSESDTDGVVTFNAFRSGVELVLDYLKIHDRRGR